ncbi:MAG: HAMP domain-containing histidine kinase [Lachnospiraceae bacterium]|nr:HAMP domain-containing histidine kinase [Lachnospiraceae bacterium]
MKEEKKSFIHSGIFCAICAVLCTFAATMLVFTTVMLALARIGGYHGMNYVQTMETAMDRISENNMAMLMDNLTLGYGNQAAFLMNAEKALSDLEEEWRPIVEDFGKKKNVDFAVIVSVYDDPLQLDLNNERVYFYKSPGYEGYEHILSKQLFSSAYYDTDSRIYRILIEGTRIYWMDLEDVDYEVPYHVHILYKTASEFTENSNDFYDNMYVSNDAKSLIGCIYEYDTNGFVYAVFEAGLALVFLILFCVSAGYRRNREGISLSFIDRIPLEIICAVVFCAECFLTFILYNMLKFYNRVHDGSIEFGEMNFLCCTVLFVIILIAVAFFGTVVVRIKAQTFWKNTLIFRFKDLFCRLVSRTAMWIAKHVPLALIVLMALPVIFIISVIEAAYIEDGSRMLAILFMLGRMVGVALMLYLIWGYCKLREGARRIAAGKLDQPVDEKHLFADYRLFARDLNGVGQSIQLAVDERMKSEHMKTQLITNVSHDIKTPLTSIINYVDLLKKEDTSEEDKKEYLEILSKQSDRLKKLIQDLIDASKASSGAMEVELTDTDLCTLAKQVAGEYHDKYENAGLSVVIKNMDESRIVKADNNLLWRVMDNLFANTLKYAMPGTRVYLESGVQEGRTFFSINNISKDELGVSEEELMERFVRGDASRNTEGSGLGLSIARSLMELMGGKLRIRIDGDMFKALIIL